MLIELTKNEVYSSYLGIEGLLKTRGGFNTLNRSIFSLFLHKKYQNFGTEKKTQTNYKIYWTVLSKFFGLYHRGPAPLYSYSETDLPSGISS